MAVRVAPAILSTIASGVAFGANSPNQPEYLRSGMPDLMTVGTPGAPLNRFSLVTASIRSLPAWCNCRIWLDTTRNHRGDLTADHIVGCRPHAAIGNVDNIRCTRLLLEHLSDQMIAGANSRGPIGELAGIGLGVGN